MKIPEIKAKTIIQNKADKNHFWFGFDYNMNLYQGCHHGCIYCDSRSDCYQISNFDQIKVKHNVLTLLSKELCSKKRKGVIAIGAMSDPYNHYEQQLKITHQALKIIKQTNFGVMITTKSHTLINDLELIKQINDKQSVIICMTITCGDDSLAKLIEPNVSISSKRFETIKQLRQHNIYAGVLMTPILPFINDTPENIREIIYRAHLANASFVYPMFGVTLRDHQRDYFYTQLDHLFPGCKERYIKQFGNTYLCNSPRLYELNVLGWNYTFDKHNINLLLGQEMQRKNYFYEYYSGSDFPFAADGKTDLSTAGTPQGSEYYKKEARLASYFMDAHYSYEDKYYVSGSFRRDGSSVFGSNHRWGNFWSVGGKWRVSGEEFLKDNSIITNATLRASYGTVGNQDIDWYAARGFYSSGYNYNEKPGMTPTSISNSDLTWETSKKFDIGFDLSLINRIHLTFDYYNEETSDALFEVPLSMTTGMSTVYQNIGAIRNRGIEASINASVINNNNLTWNIYANMTWNKNKIIKLSTDEPIEYTYQIIEEGRPYRQFYMKEYAGVDRENGKPLWYLNEEGNETTSDYNAAAKRYVGDADPKVLGGFGTNLSWKGFDFNMNFTYRLGGKVFDSGASFTGFGMANRTPLKDVALNSWTEENKDAKYPQYIYGDPNKATQTSSRFLYSSNFLRISNMTLGYTVPVNLTKKIFIQKLRAYISIDNLYTFTSNDFVGYNPETYSNGVIAWQYPATRTFIGGIQLSF